MQKFSRLSLVVTLLWLICSGNTLNWQGTGNLSQENRTIIWDYINTNFSTSWTYSDISTQKGTMIQNFTVYFSNYLNDLWAPAWNIVVIYNTLTGQNFDSVLYGYAFRNHWMWHNGFLMKDGHYVGFVLWKDYNCNQWWTFNHFVSIQQNK